MPHTWRTATLLQAQSDYEMFLRLQKSRDAPLCHRLHYLQMTTEKLAKAFLTPPGGRYPNTHDAFVRFVRVVRGRQDYRAAFGFSQAAQYHAYLDSLLPLAQAIENEQGDCLL